MAQGSIDNPMESTLTSLPGCPKDGVHLNPMDEDTWHIAHQPEVIPLHRVGNASFLNFLKNKDAKVVRLSCQIRECSVI
jgi:hypothetical protein